jgi:hypothetical protein
MLGELEEEERKENPSERAGERGQKKRMRNKNTLDSNEEE